MERGGGSDASLVAIDARGEVSPLGALGEALAGRSAVAALCDAVRPLLPAALARHFGLGEENALTLLVPPRACPELSARNDGQVVAFLASGPWVETLLEGNCAPGELCYRALSRVLGPGETPIALAVVDRAGEGAPALPRGGAGGGVAIEAIMPHRGTDDHLRAALSSLLRQSCPARIILCFDQPPPVDLCRALATEKAVAMFEVVPSPAGPYVPRQHFAMASAADYIAFQDSDDFSVASRIEALVACAQAEGADLVGCHELRLDETKRTVEAVRYPLDVNEALRLGSGHAQLFSTAVARVDTLRRIGGFSTVRTFGADKQFHLRAYWDARMLNMDAFLYVRRLRARSLTTSAATGMGSAIRQEVTRRWKDAFQDIKDGRLALADSALRVEHGQEEYRIRDLSTGLVSPALLRAEPEGGPATAFSAHQPEHGATMESAAGHLPRPPARLDTGRIASRLHDALVVLAKISLVYSGDGADDREILDVDDYIQTVLIGESLVANRGFNHRDLVRRYRSRPGHIIGGREVAASGISARYKGQVKKLIDSRDLNFRARDGITSGSAMKVACIAAFYRDDMAALVENTDRITRVTHESVDSRLAALLTVLRFHQIFLDEESSTAHLKEALLGAIGQLGIAGSEFFVDLFDTGAAMVASVEDPVRLLADLNRVIGLSHIATSAPIAACLWSFRGVDPGVVLASWGLHDKYEIRAGDAVIRHIDWRFEPHRQHFLDLGYTGADSRMLGEEPRSHFDLDTFFSNAFSLIAAQHGLQGCVAEGELDEFTDNLEMLARNLVDLSGR